MRYVTIKELSDMVRNNLWRIPHDIDLVVGIPRSGMLPANMIALFLNKRLTDIDSFVESGKVFGYGLSRGKFIMEEEIKKVLVVDDSIYTGASLADAKKKLDTITDRNYEYIFCSPIATSAGAEKVDLSFDIIDDDRVFEWNIFHHSILNSACIDIDGVLCVDPSEDDDGEKYQTFLQTAKPLFTPTCRINTLVSCRLEKYRPMTEEWLKRNGITYDQLIMLDFPNKAARVAWNKHGEYKGEYYKQRGDCLLFIESSYKQAKTIVEISSKPVYCVETNSLMLPTIQKRKQILHAIRNRFPNQYRHLRSAYYGIKRQLT